MIAQVGLMTAWRFKLVGYPWPDEGREVFFGEAESGKAGHIDVLQMEYILDVMDQVCIQANWNC